MNCRTVASRMSRWRTRPRRSYKTPWRSARRRPRAARPEFGERRGHDRQPSRDDRCALPAQPRQVELVDLAGLDELRAQLVQGSGGNPLFAQTGLAQDRGERFRRARRPHGMLPTETPVGVDDALQLVRRGDLGFLERGFLEPAIRENLRV